MRYTIIGLACLVVFFACRTGNKNTRLIHPDNLAVEQYVVNIDRDTTLETKNGALLKIPKGALATDQGNTVTLEIKEAYSLQQMIQAGLTTQSNGEPLSSGGMIYINAAAGQQVTIKQKIRVAIPTDFLQAGMQLFKGTENNGKVNWTNPDTLPVNKNIAIIDEGKTLFANRCGNCHALDRDMTGPGLAHMIKRFPPEKESNGRYYYHAYSYYREDRPGKADTSNGHLVIYPHPYDLYKCNLAERYHSLGPMFSSDSVESNLAAIYRYIQNESDRLNLPIPAHAYLKDCVDSCGAYSEEISDLQNRKAAAQEKRQDLIRDNGPMVEDRGDSTWRNGSSSAPQRPLQPPVDFDERVSPENYDAQYYQFTIDSFGWLNIDMMLKSVTGVEESELFVRVEGQYQERIKVYLIIPSVKVYGEGGPAERDPAEFAFFYKNGKLPLPQHEKAYILAVTENETSIAFGLKEFTTTTKQELSIELHAATKEEFTTAMQQFDNNRLHIKVADSKNAGEIRKTDAEQKDIDRQLKEAERLKPKGCNCDCGIRNTVIADAADILDGDTAIAVGVEEPGNP